jgi:hypothetical protein
VAGGHTGNIGSIYIQSHSQQPGSRGTITMPRPTGRMPPWMPPTRICGLRACGCCGGSSSAADRRLRRARWLRQRQLEWQELPPHRPRSCRCRQLTTNKQPAGRRPPLCQHPVASVAPRSADSGVADSAAADSGVADSGVADSGVADSGVADSGVADSAAADSAAADSAAADALCAAAPRRSAGFAGADSADAPCADAQCARPPLRGKASTRTVPRAMIDTAA